MTRSFGDLVAESVGVTYLVFKKTHFLNNKNNKLSRKFKNMKSQKMINSSLLLVMEYGNI